MCVYIGKKIKFVSDKKLLMELVKKKKNLKRKERIFNIRKVFFNLRV